MRRTPIDDGWFVRPRQSIFSEQSTAAPDWVAVTLPHDALIGTERTATATPATGYFAGGAWEYRRVLDIPADVEGTTIELEFEGVQRDAVVLVNGSRAAHQAYGYSNFTVRIDHLLRFGEDNELLVEARVGRDSRWYPGGGIYRDVWLLQGGPIHLAASGIDVRSPAVDDDGAVTTVAAVVRNRSTSTRVVTLRVELVDAAGTVVALDDGPVTTFAGDELIVRRRLFLAQPKRWSPDHPHLYACRTTLLDGGEVLDEESTTFGIRTLSLDSRRGLRINGEPVLLRGACVHHDNGPIGAATIDRAEARRVELLKAAGFNAIRSAHNPMSRAMLDACDRLGVIVMDELVDMWGTTKSDHDHSLRLAGSWEDDLDAMIRKDRNHPSVVFYSIGNEIPDGSTPTGLHEARAMAERVRALDDTRFVTQAVSGLLVAGSEVFDDLREAAQSPSADEDTGLNTSLTNLADIMERVLESPRVDAATQEAFSLLDVAGYNYMDVRFGPDGERYPDRVIVSTESYPRTIDTEWARVTQHPQVIGEFTWTGWDYLGEAGIGRVGYADEQAAPGMAAFHGEYPWIAAWCGDIDITGHRRPQSYFREIVFGLQRDPYLTVWRPEYHGRTVVHSSPWAFDDVVASWSWPGFEGKPVTVVVYADADEVEMLLDGRSLGRDKVERFRTELEVTYEPGTLEAIAWRGSEEIGRMGLRSAAGALQVSASTDRTEIAAGPFDAAFVELTLVDEGGTLWTGSDRLVTVAIDGPGVVQGLASANPVTDEPFTGSSITTFDGRALAVVRPTGTGTITLTVTAEGCEPRQVRIDAR